MQILNIVHSEDKLQATESIVKSEVISKNKSSKKTLRWDLLNNIERLLATGIQAILVRCFTPGKIIRTSIKESKINLIKQFKFKYKFTQLPMI